MMSQKQAVVSTILAVLEERNSPFKYGATDNKQVVDEVLSDADRKSVRDAIFAMFRGNQITLSPEAKAKFADDAELKKYVSGLVNNWIRKDPQFNNGKAYVAKNPGSRAGSGDTQIREMKKLLAQTTNETHKQLIQSQIDQRVAQIKPAKDNTVDASKLPENLRHLVK